MMGIENCASFIGSSFKLGMQWMLIAQNHR